MTSPPEACDMCKGTGRASVYRERPFHEGYEEVKCWICKGTGSTDTPEPDTCPDCYRCRGAIDECACTCHDKPEAPGEGPEPREWTLKAHTCGCCATVQGFRQLKPGETVTVREIPATEPEEKE